MLYSRALIIYLVSINSGGFREGRAGRAGRAPPPPKIRKAYVIQR